MEEIQTKIANGKAIGCDGGIYLYLINDIWYYCSKDFITDYKKIGFITSSIKVSHIRVLNSVDTSKKTYYCMTPDSYVKVNGNDEEVYSSVNDGARSYFVFDIPSTFTSYSTFTELVNTIDYSLELQEDDSGIKYYSSVEDTAYNDNVIEDD